MKKNESLALRDMIGALGASTIRVDGKGRTIITMPASERGRFVAGIDKLREALR